MVFPAPAPTVVGQNVTVNQLLQRPLEISRDLADLTLEQFFAEELFTAGPPAPAGAVVYTKLTRNDLYPDRTAGRSTPGAGFPLIITSHAEPTPAYAEEYGGKFYLTYQAIRRNAINEMTRNERLLANELVLKWNAIATAMLNAAVDAVGASAVVVGEDFSLDATNIFKVLASAQLAADQRRMGIVLDTVIVDHESFFNMLAQEKFQKLFTEATRERMAREGNKINSIEVAGFTVRKSHQQAAGTGLAVASGQVGGRHSDAPSGEEGENIAYDGESGIATQVYDDPDNTRKFVQSWKSQTMYVDNPFGVYRLEGI